MTKNMLTETAFVVPGTKVAVPRWLLLAGGAGLIIILLLAKRQASVVSSEEDTGESDTSGSGGLNDEMLDLISQMNGAQGEAEAPAPLPEATDGRRGPVDVSRGSTDTTPGWDPNEGLVTAWAVPTGVSDGAAYFNSLVERRRESNTGDTIIKSSSTKTGVTKQVSDPFAGAKASVVSFQGTPRVTEIGTVSAGWSVQPRTTGLSTARAGVTVQPTRTFLTGGQ